MDALSLVTQQEVSDSTQSKTAQVVPFLGGIIFGGHLVQQGTKSSSSNKILYLSSWNYWTCHQPPATRLLQLFVPLSLPLCPRLPRTSWNGSRLLHGPPPRPHPLMPLLLWLNLRGLRLWFRLLPIPWHINLSTRRVQRVQCTLVACHL
jgi:hypothetical protein